MDEKIKGIIDRLNSIHAVALDKTQLYINNMTMAELNQLIRDTTETLIEAALPQPGSFDFQQLTDELILRGEIINDLKRRIRELEARENGA